MTAETAFHSEPIHLQLLLSRDAGVFSWRYWLVKRGSDTCAAALLIALLFVPCALIALLIVLNSRGSVFYREQRIGRNGAPFKVWKFRSMYRAAEQARRLGAHAADHASQEWRMHRKHLHDPRITPVGRFLRRWSLDELPQLLNVLFGEMSFVGPRPIIQAERHHYGSLMYYYCLVLPGISGLWQVSGRSDVGYPTRTRLDAKYVTSWSLRQDFHILMRTIPAVLAKRGAY